jgi:hypothetical protein
MLVCYTHIIRDALSVRHKIPSLLKCFLCAPQRVFYYAIRSIMLAMLLFFPFFGSEFPVLIPRKWARMLKTFRIS